MVPYLFVGGDGADADYDLSNFIKSRTLTFDRKGPATCTWTMDGRSEKAAQIVEMEHDLKVYRGGTLFYRGRIMPATDEVGGEEHRVQMGSFDYRGMLEHRLIQDGWSTGWYATEQGTICAAILFATQILPGGSLGITSGATTTGVTKDYGYDVGQTIADVIDGLAQTDDGFDWEITPALVFNCYNPKRGSAKSDPLDYGGAVFSFSRRLARNDFANAVIGMGEGFLIPESVATAGIASDPRGRWEATVSWPNIVIQEANDGRTAYLLEQKSELAYTYSLSLRQGWWEGPSHVWLGDELPFRATSGRLDINETVVVESITINLDDSGVEFVTMEVSGL